MSWDEQFSERYDEWSAHMTDDVAFYVELAREADGPIVELAVGNGRVAIPIARRPGAGDRHRHLAGDARAGARRRGRRRRSSTCGLATCASSRSRSRPRSSTARSGRSCTCRPGPTAAARSSAWPRRSARAGSSRGTRSPSTTGSRPSSTAPTATQPVPHTLRYATADNRIDIVLDTVEPVRSGGRRRTSGSG